MHQHQIDFRDTEVEPRTLRNVLSHFATGVTVVTTCCADGKMEGVTVNSFSSVSLDPPLVLWSLHRDAPSMASFVNAGRFAINVLAKHQRRLSQHFSRPAHHKFEGIDHERGIGECPLLPESVAQFECRIESTINGGDHIIFIGRIERATYNGGHPLIFSAGRYCEPSLLAEVG